VGSSASDTAEWEGTTDAPTGCIRAEAFLTATTVDSTPTAHAPGGRDHVAEVRKGNVVAVAI
jgi:hypothetical protein